MMGTTLTPKSVHQDNHALPVSGRCDPKVAARCLTPLLASIVVGGAVLLGGRAAMAKILPLGEPFQVNVFTAGDQTYPHAVALADGGFVVLWSGPVSVADSRVVTHGRRFDSAATAIGAEFVVQDGGRPPVVALGPSLVMAIDDDLGRRIGQFGLDGILGKAFPVMYDYGPLAVTVTDTGAVVAAWVEGIDDPLATVRAQRLDFGGEVNQPKFIVDDHVTEGQGGLALEGLPDGAFIALWEVESNGSLWARVFEADNTPRNDRSLVIAPEDLGDGTWPVLCSHSDSGDMAVGWRSTNSFIGFRRLGPEGQIAGPPRCTGIDSSPSLLCAPNQQIVVVGQNVKLNSGKGYVSARAFGADDRIIGTFLIPSSTDEDVSGEPTAALLSDDTVLLAWQDCKQTPGSICDIFAQHLAISSEPDCAGDCNGDGRVSIDELILGVDISLLGKADPVRCAAMEDDSECGVSISELVAAVNSSLSGCD